MFVKIKILSKSHRHSGKCHNRDLLYTMPSFLFSFLCMMLVGNIFLAPILLVSGNAEDGFPDPNFSRRHLHRQQQRRSVSSNTGAPSNQIAISSEENEIHSNIVDNGQVQNLLGNSTGRPKVCSSCINRELYRNLTLIEIKKDILKKLNMQHGPPQVSRKDVDEHMMGQIVDRYRTTHGHIDHYGGIQNDARRGGGFDDDNEFQAKQITILAQNPNAFLPASLTQAWDIQYFSLDSLLAKENMKVYNAKLYVHLPSNHGPVSIGNNSNQTALKNESQSMVNYGDEAWVYLYYLTVDKNTHAGSMQQTEATRVKLLANRGGWIDLDMMEILSIWLKYPRENLGLHIVVRTKAGGIIPVGVQHQLTNVPFLQIDLQEDTWNKRARRNTPKTCREPQDKDHEECCLWDFVVDFERDFGWEWVIHPPKYRANYCNGDCGLGVMMPSSTHAHIMQQSNIKVRSPCCTPRKMSGISMLYLDPNKNVILGKLPRMKVDECGCA